MTRKKVVKKEPTVETEETQPKIKIVTEDTYSGIKKEDSGTILKEPIVEEKQTGGTLDDRLLAYIKQHEEGAFNIPEACVALNVENTTLVHQAWDRLFDKGLVPYLNIK